MLGELQWSYLEARRDRSSLFLFHKNRCGAVPIEKDEYFTDRKLPDHHIVLNIVDTRHTVVP